MITELKENTWYKLIDKNKFLTVVGKIPDKINIRLYTKYFHNRYDTVFISKVTDGEGFSEDGECLICEHEYQLLEEVADKYGNTLNSEISPIEEDDVEDERISAWHEIYDYYLDNQEVLGVYDKPTALGTIINCMENLVKLTKETPSVVQTHVKYTEEMYKNGVLPEKGMLVWSHWAEDYTTVNGICFHTDSNDHDYKVLLNTHEGCIVLKELKFPENRKDNELKELEAVLQNTGFGSDEMSFAKAAQQYFYDKYNLGDK